MAVLLLAVGGPYVVQRLGRPATIQAASILPRPQSGQKRVTLEVSGMFCANCASRVSHELETTPGVVACDVDVDAHRATVVCDRTLADSTPARPAAPAGRGDGASAPARGGSPSPPSPVAARLRGGEIGRPARGAALAGAGGNAQPAGAFVVSSRG